MAETMTLLEFQNRFRTEEDCVEFLEKLRWPNGFVCPNCNHDDGYPIRTRGLIQCANCRYHASVTAGTIFHKTRVPLRNWFWLIYQVANDKGGASSTRLASQLGMYQPTVWYLLHKIRHAMGSRDQNITLAGVIELDEAVIGPEARKKATYERSGRDNNDDRKPPRPRFKTMGRKPTVPRKRKQQVEIIVMAERENARAGNIAMKVIEARTRDDIRETVSLQVEDFKQSFKTDGAQAHWVLKTMGHMLEAYPISGPESCEELPIVHRAISLLRRMLIGTYHGISAKHLQRYLQEFCFRFNRRDKQQAISESLLRACVFTVPMRYAEVIL